MSDQRVKILKDVRQGRHQLGNFGRIQIWLR